MRRSIKLTHKYNGNFVNNLHMFRLLINNAPPLLYIKDII